MLVIDDQGKTPREIEIFKRCIPGVICFRSGIEWLMGSSRCNLHTYNNGIEVVSTESTQSLMADPAS